MQISELFTPSVVAKLFEVVTDACASIVAVFVEGWYAVIDSVDSSVTILDVCSLIVDEATT